MKTIVLVLTFLMCISCSTLKAGYLVNSSRFDSGLEFYNVYASETFDSDINDEIKRVSQLQYSPEEKSVYIFSEVDTDIMIHIFDLESYKIVKEMKFVVHEHPRHYYFYSGSLYYLVLNGEGSSCLNEIWMVEEQGTEVKMLSLNETVESFFIHDKGIVYTLYGWKSIGLGTYLFTGAEHIKLCEQNANFNSAHEILVSATGFGIIELFSVKDFSRQQIDVYDKYGLKTAYIDELYLLDDMLVFRYYIKTEKRPTLFGFVNLNIYDVYTLSLSNEALVKRGRISGGIGSIYDVYY